ncbi:MAG: hypothetical protein E6K96_02290 [Thaumarchaeota archaeon]|nr:MAG: hypothetical protein E6K96_02290 [Nitrososphaerota archaeon]
MKTHRLKLAMNRYAFHWAFPEMLADELGLFEREWIQVEWFDATPSTVVNKGSMYTDLLNGGITDLYHAGEWACINRVLDSPESCIVARSPPGRGTLNSTFSLYAAKKSVIRKASDLAGKPVAIEEGTGSYYTTLLDLERHLKRDEIKLVQIGEPHRRLLSLLHDEVEAASLLGPWAEIADAVGLREVLRTTRRNPTTTVARRDRDPLLLRAFFRVVNKAIGKINANPGRYRRSYFNRVKSILVEMPEEISSLAPRLERRISVPRWKPWVKYTTSDFDRTYGWLVSHGLSPDGHRSAEVVARYSPDVFA